MIAARLDSQLLLFCVKLDCAKKHELGVWNYKTSGSIDIHGKKSATFLLYLACVRLSFGGDERKSGRAVGDMPLTKG